MEREIDARGLACPQPVVKAREALREGCGAFVVLVDNETARDNVSRFATSSGCSVDTSPVEGGFRVTVCPVSRREAEVAEAACPPAGGGTVLLIASDEVGRGERELGTALMKAFLYTSALGDELPAKVVFMNTGVRLVTENDDTIAHVADLVDRGVDVLVCGTCLDYYGLKGMLKAGRVSNMYEIQSSLVGASSVLSV